MGKPKWSYRIVRVDGMVPTYGLHEVYYDERDNIVAISEQPMAPFGESISELMNDLSRMLSACALPVLTLPLRDEET